MQTRTPVTALLLICYFAPSLAEASVTVSVVGKDDNSLELEGEWDADNLNLGHLDCLEDVEITLAISVSDEDTSGRELYIFSGDSCDDSDDEDECDDEIIELDADETTVDVSVSWILDDGSCSDDVDTAIWVGLLESSSDKDDNATWSTEIDVDYENSSPDTPDGIEVGVGENNLLVKWDQADDDLGGYVAIYNIATDSGESDAGISCDGPLIEGEQLSDEMNWEEAGSSSSKVRVYDLTNGETYQVAVASFDEYGNPSPLSEVVCATPEETLDFSEVYADAGGTGGGEYCFVATGAFGDYDHPAVRVLREFRDEFLLKMPAGEAIVRLYYFVGPGVVTVIGKQEGVWSAVRTGLHCFAGMSVLLVRAGPSRVLGAFAGAVLLGLLLGVFVPRRRGAIVENH